MYRVQLGDEDVIRVRALASELASQYRGVEDPRFLRDLTSYAQELPRALRVPLNEFRLAEPAGACLVTGYPVDDGRIGPTPAYWHGQADPSLTVLDEIYFLLCGALLGEPVAWATQQDEHLVHDVLPIRGHENIQINSASEMEIWWHTEDAFHPYRADYVGLMCLRNDAGIESTYACVNDVELDDTTLEILFEPRFVLLPDESQRPPEYRDDGDARRAELVRRGRSRFARMRREPPRVPVLFGDPASPYLCLDPYFMARDQEDEVAARALDRLIAAIDTKLSCTALRPGELLFVDNFKAVHGRRSFTARYDGRDRWLKRLNIARDLRKSRDARISAESRVLF